MGLGDVYRIREDLDVPLPDAAVARAVEAALLHGGRPDRVVDVIFVDDPTLARMHGEFLDDPTETDVITFDLEDAPGSDRPPDPEGDADGRGPDAELYVSVDRARAVAPGLGSSVEQELTLYVVHGALHLVGFDDHDPEDRRAMRAAEAEVMSGLGPFRDGA